MTDEKQYSVTDAAKELGVGKARIRQLIYGGRFPNAKKETLGKYSIWTIPESDLDNERVRKTGYWGRLDKRHEGEG